MDHCRRPDSRGGELPHPPIGSQSRAKVADGTRLVGREALDARAVGGLEQLHHQLPQAHAAAVPARWAANRDARARKPSAQ
jgi:hypothetical protein